MDLNQMIFKYLVYYPVVFIRRENVAYYQRELLRTQYMRSEDIEALQLMKLRNLVRYVKRFVPFYEEKMRQISAEDISTLKDIKVLPFTTRNSLRREGERLLSRKRMGFLTKKTTGGSTGEPATIFKTSGAMARELAATWRGYSWAGIDIGDKQGRFWGLPFTAKGRVRARLVDFVTNRKRCSAFSFNEEKLEEYTRVLKAFKPKYFYGYVSMLEEYAKYFEKNRRKPPFSLQCIITTSEVLTSYHRQLLEHIFCTRVFNEYGCGELGSVAHECEEGSMHIMAENMIVELLDGSSVCGPGMIGELVITELNNRAMPLIRYRTGDFACFSGKRCKCGRTLPIIENVVGRAYDTVRNREGRLFHGEFFMYIFEEAKRKNLGIEAFQVVQLEHDRFKIRIVAGRDYGRRAEGFVKRRIREDFDPKARIEFEKVDNIERELSGKMRVIVGMPDRFSG